jgi:PAS domain S-box-containing protein
MSRRLRNDLSVELSPRELQLLEFAASGLTDQAIANELGISLATIATYWGRIRIKFGPLSRTEIVAMHLRGAADREIQALQDQNDLLKKQLNDSDQQNGLLIYSMNVCPDALTILNSKGQMIYANQVASSWIGLSPTDVIGRKPSDFYVEDRVERWNEWFTAAWNNPDVPELTQNVDSFFRHIDGTITVYVCNIRKIAYNGESFMLIVARKQN